VDFEEIHTRIGYGHTDFVMRQYDSCLKISFIF